MHLAEVADYIQSKYGIEASYVDLAGQTLAAVTVPGANESFALLLKKDGRETFELKAGALAKFLAAQPAFGPAVFMQDPAWIRVDLDNPALNDRFFTRPWILPIRAPGPWKQRKIWQKIGKSMKSTCWMMREKTSKKK